MMLSIFLAKLIGLYLVIAGILAIVRQDEFKESIREFVHSRGLVLFSGFMALILGLAIAIGHPIWTGWPVIITILGYLAILQGLMRISFPVVVQEMTQRVLTGGYWIMVAVMIVLGVILAYLGLVQQ